MKNRFRLISEIKVFILGDNLYIASPDSKSCINKVKSKIPKSEKLAEELQIEVDDISARIDSELNVIISSNKFPGGIKKEYLLANFDEKELGDLIVSQNLSKGKCSDKFEPAIDDETGSIILTCMGMPSYSLASDEMIRRMNCQMLKKTKTYIPGHRYDTVDNTLYYLGKVYSHVNTDQNSDYIRISSRQVHLFTKDIGNAKSISEVMNNGVFFVGDSFGGYYKLEQSENLGLMVDSGEALINDYTAYSDYVEDIFNNSLEILNNHTEYLYGIKTLLEVFKFSNGPENSVSEAMKQYLTDFLTKDLHRILYIFWNDEDTYTSSRLDLSKNTPKDELVSRSISRYFSEILDANVKKHSYYGNLFQNIDVDFVKIAGEMFNSWNPAVLEEDFDIFVKYSRGKTYNVRLRTEKSSKYSHHLTTVKLSEVLKDSALIDCIKNICTEARTNHGVDCSCYEKINVGTFSKPLVYENITISTKDIVNYYKERGIEIPENLKSGILIDKFSQVNINVDLGAPIE